MRSQNIKRPRKSLIMSKSIKEVVKALLFYNDGSAHSLLLLTRSKQLFHGMEDLPGGKLEADELPMPGLIREVKEETQLEISKLFHIATHEWECPDGTYYLEHLYYSIVDTKSVIVNPEEHSSFRWVELEHIEQSTLHPKIKELILHNTDRINELLRN